MEERSELVGRERVSMKLSSCSFLLGLDSLLWIAPYGDKACRLPLISSLSLQPIVSPGNTGRPQLLGPDRPF